MLNRSHFTTLLNRPIELHLADGTTRRGILHSVSDDGVFLRPISGTRLATGDVLNAKLLGELEKSDEIQEAFFFFPFLFFFPFFFIRRRFFF
jgi:hypothetical protein